MERTDRADDILNVVLGLGAHLVPPVLLGLSMTDGPGLNEAASTVSDWSAPSSVRKINE